MAEKTKNQVPTGFISGLTSPIYFACLLSEKSCILVLRLVIGRTQNGDIHNYACAKRAPKR